MTEPDLQAQIDRVPWYHEFDFGNGLKARSTTPDVAAHRVVWQGIQRQLDKIDFRGKAVLDVGCWDGYWSFYAERRGARSVLASDDVGQNWGGGDGLRLAKQLLKSDVEINQNQSVYELVSLGRKFDIVLCLGVYYHLYDPFYAFAQVRHCCHPDTVVVFEGDVGRYGLEPGAVRYTFTDAAKPAFLPSEEALDHMLRAAYFQVRSRAWLTRPPRGWAKKLVHRLRTGERLPRELVSRAVTVCAPFAGVNPLHHYEPPFGLHAYDDRFRDAPRVTAAVLARSA